MTTEITQSPKPRKLTLRQSAWVDGVVATGNLTEAARLAKYSPKVAKQAGYDNMTKPYLRQAVAERKATVAERLGITPDRVAGAVLETMDACKGGPQASASLKAAEMLGSEFLDMFVPRVEVTHTDTAAVQLVALLRDTPVEARLSRLQELEAIEAQYRELPALEASGPEPTMAQDGAQLAGEARQAPGEVLATAPTKSRPSARAKVVPKVGTGKRGKSGRGV